MSSTENTPSPQPLSQRDFIFLRMGPPLIYAAGWLSSEKAAQMRTLRDAGAEGVSSFGPTGLAPFLIFLSLSVVALVMTSSVIERLIKSRGLGSN